MIGSEDKSRSIDDSTIPNPAAIVWKKMAKS